MGGMSGLKLNTFNMFYYTTREICKYGFLEYKYTTDCTAVISVRFSTAVYFYLSLNFVSFCGLDKIRQTRKNIQPY